MFWPAQLLPPQLKEANARVLVYGYDADIATFKDGSPKRTIHDDAEDLVAELCTNRREENASQRPILFIAHSLGGLMVKRALLSSYETHGHENMDLPSIFVSTFAILFLGTPHYYHSPAEWISQLEKICSATMPKASMDSQRQLVDSLKDNLVTLQSIDYDFFKLSDRFRIFNFYEAQSTKLNGKSQFLVDEESAAPSTGVFLRAAIEQDHAHMCNFENKHAPGFLSVAEGIRRFVYEAPAVISRNWDLENAKRQAAKRTTLGEGLSSADSAGWPIHGSNRQAKWQYLAPTSPSTSIATGAIRPSGFSRGLQVSVCFIFRLFHALRKLHRC